MATDAELYAGDTKILTIAITDANGNAVDVSTATAIVYGVYGRISSTAIISKTLAGGITVVTSTVTVTLDPEDTADIAPGAYIHECEVTQASGAVYTVLQGKLTIIKDYVHS
jgi:hypothetical protein